MTSGKFAFPVDGTWDWCGLLQIRSAVDRAVLKIALRKMVVCLCEFGFFFPVLILFQTKQSRIKPPTSQTAITKEFGLFYRSILQTLLQKDVFHSYHFLPSFWPQNEGKLNFTSTSWESDVSQLLFCKLLERQIMRWEPSYANKVATSLLAKNSFSTCAVRWKRRPLVYIEQTVTGGRREGKLQLFV